MALRAAARGALSTGVGRVPHFRDDAYGRKVGPDHVQIKTAFITVSRGGNNAERHPNEGRAESQGDQGNCNSIR